MPLMITPNEAVELEDARLLRGLALPFNVPGHSSSGLIQAKPGSVTYPDDLRRIKLFIEHSDVGGIPVGYCTALDERDDGIYMEFHVSDTIEGDRALHEAREGVRDALSVEIIAIELAGDTIKSGILTAVALVPVPAFDDARLTFSAHYRDQSLGEKFMPQTENQAAKVDKIDDATNAKVNPTGTTVNNNAPANDTVTTSDAPASAPAGMVFASQRAEKPVTFAVAMKTIATLRGNQSTDSLTTAALADITQAAHVDQRAPGWLGELWSGIPYERQIIPTMTTKTLTSMRATGWRYTTPPEVNDYAGNKAEIPTNTPVTEAVTLEVKRLAGGHDIDRIYLDFNDSEFIASYFSRMAESYARESDDRAAKFIATEAAKNKGAKQADLLRAAAKARQMINLATRAQASTFLVHPDDIFSLMDITTMDNPAYLKLLGVEPENFITTEFATKGAVIAYAKPAVEFYELSGSPIRVQAEHLSHGGQDAALFGYYATNITHAKGVVQVPFGSAA